MITAEELIHGWTSAGPKIVADLLDHVFLHLDNPDLVRNHDFVVSYLEVAIGPNRKQQFLERIAGLVNEFAIMNLKDIQDLKHGQTEKEKTS